MYLSNRASPLGRSSAAPNAAANRMPIVMLRRVMNSSLLLFGDPVERRVQRRVAPFQQRPPRRADFLVRLHADSLEWLAALRDVVRDGVLKAIAVGEHLDYGRQRCPRRARSENARALDILQPARQDLRSGPRAPVDQHRQRPAERLRPREHREVDCRALHVHLPEFQPGPVAAGDPPQIALPPSSSPSPRPPPRPGRTPPPPPPPPPRRSRRDCRAGRSQSLCSRGSLPPPPESSW